MTSAREVENDMTPNRIIYLPLPSIGIPIEGFNGAHPEPGRPNVKYTYEEICLAAAKAYEAHVKKEVTLSVVNGLLLNQILRLAIPVKSRVPPSADEKFDVHELFNEDVEEGDVHALPVLNYNGNLTFILLTNNPLQTTTINNARRRMVVQVYSSFHHEE